jgi:two-component system, response regulator YesN
MDWRVAAVLRKLKSWSLAEPLTLRALSADLHTSSANLGDLFFKELGAHFHEYVLCLRLARACDLLTDPRLSVKEVAYRAGFKEPSSFYRAFRAKYDSTPRQYRIRQFLNSITEDIK